MEGFSLLRVAAVEQLTDDAVAVTFEVPPAMAQDFRFHAGQHLTFRRVDGGEDLRRTYSVCSSAVSGPLRVAVKRMEGGAFSTWVTKELAVGDQLEVLPPAGRFGPAVAPDRTRRYGLIAAGSGITPVLAIAATVLEVELASEVVLLFGNRTINDVMFLEELADLKDRYPGRLQLLHVLSREEQVSELLSGRLDRARLERILTALVPVDSIDEWYVCGPFGMVNDARDALVAAGATEVHVEMFHAEPAPPRVRPAHVNGAVEGGSEVVVELHGRRTVLSVDPDGLSVLDSVLAVRADAPYACKGGVCGTCRARVISGAVEMDVNYALEPDELAAGVVLTCQSHPTTPKVELQYL